MGTSARWREAALLLGVGERTPAESRAAWVERIDG